VSTVVAASGPWTSVHGTRVLMVDDHVLLAESLAIELRQSGCVVDVVTEPAPPAVLAHARSFQPQVVLLDFYLGTPGVTSLDLIGPLSAVGASVVMLTGVTNKVLLAACLEAGAVGVLPKTAHFDVVFDAVQHAARHENVLRVGEREELLERFRHARREWQEGIAPFERLTPRERAVLRALMDGTSATDIARSAVVSLTTVRSHIRAILQKLDVGSQLAAVALAHRVGWNAAASGDLAASPDWNAASLGAA
jgi:two-component system nitrate/nitrite response regulator NarL